MMHRTIQFSIHYTTMPYTHIKYTNNVFYNVLLMELHKLSHPQSYLQCPPIAVTYNVPESILPVAVAGESSRKHLMFSYKCNLSGFSTLMAICALGLKTLVTLIADSVSPQTGYNNLTRLTHKPVTTTSHDQHTK